MAGENEAISRKLQDIVRRLRGIRNVQFAEGRQTPEEIRDWYSRQINAIAAELVSIIGAIKIVAKLFGDK